jgi:hypothetical protein
VSRHAARADDRDRLAFGHDGTCTDQGGAEMQERDGIAVGGLDRDREPVRRDLAREGHRSSGRCNHRLAESPLEIDAAVLSRDERVLLIEDVALQHRPRNRPRPGAGRRRSRKRQEHHADRDPDEGGWSLPVLQTESKVPGRP